MGTPTQSTDPVNEETEQLRARIAELERRLAHLAQPGSAVRLEQVSDSAEHKNVEQALRESHHLLNLLVDNSPLAVVEWDSDFRITRWAGAAPQVFGWTAAEAIDKRIDELPWVYEEDIPLVNETMADMMSGKRPSNVNKNRNVRKDGAVIHCEWYNSSIRDASGRLVSVLSQVLDVTERKRAEADSQSSEDKFRLLADSIPQLAWMADPGGSIFWYNQRWYDYTGTTFEDMQGWGWRKVHHPDHVERVILHFKRCVEAGIVWEDTFPLRAKDGRYRAFLSRALPMRDAEGKIVRWFGTNTDITERLDAEERLRASEEHFRRLYEADIVGIASADPEKLIEANDVFLKLVGYSREELAAGRIRWRESTPPEYLHLDERAIQELLSVGSCKPFEKELFRKDGSRVPILIGATLLERSPMEWLCFIVDLTERKQLERKLFEKQKLESIGLLAGGIAHDFNNILVAILGNASLAQDMLPPGNGVSKVLAQIVRASERAAHLTSQMLAYSGKGRFLLEPVNLSEVVSETTELLLPSIRKKVSLHLDLEPGLPAVEADPGQMQQVVMNLVLNAAEAIGDKAGSVFVRTYSRSVGREVLEGADIEPGAYVFLDVRDTGHGMDDATRVRIFDPFFTTKFTGRGLGLSAVAGIVRGHKGTIKVSSAPGKGSTFAVLLPAAARPADSPEPPVSVTAEPRGTGTVLVVDDEDVVLQTARTVLERQGFDVLHAGSGPAAIEILKRERDRVRAIILDLSMPDMSGYETLPELRKINPEVHVIVSSGYSEAETMRQFAGQSISGFIQKPYTGARLAQTLTAALRRE